MSVVQAETARRWSLVAAGVAVLVALGTAGPAVRLALTRPDVSGVTAAGLVAKTLRADRTLAYSGLAESRGGTSLPDLPRLGDVSQLLGDTTRSRVWWAGPDRWRVDTVDVTGEQDTYAEGPGVLTLWDYERNRLDTVIGTPRVRFPRADDLLPPQAARRLLDGLGSTDRLDVLPDRRLVAGRPAIGLRVRPATGLGTVTSADVWTDARTGLPLAVTLRGPAGVVALDTSFLRLDLGAPDDRVLTPPEPPGARGDVVTESDLVQQIDRVARFPLPDRLAGLDRTDALVTSTSGRGTATYGAGLARFVVLPLRRRLGTEVVSGAISKGAQPLEVRGGAAYLLRSGVLTVVVARDGDGDRVFLLSGLVQPEVLQRAAQDVLAVRWRR